MIHEKQAMAGTKQRRSTRLRPGSNAFAAGFDRAAILPSRRLSRLIACCPAL
jgi:hypothetical protein